MLKNGERHPSFIQTRAVQGHPRPHHKGFKRYEHSLTSQGSVRFGAYAATRPARSPGHSADRTRLVRSQLDIEASQHLLSAVSESFSSIAGVGRLGLSTICSELKYPFTLPSELKSLSFRAKHIALVCAEAATRSTRFKSALGLKAPANRRLNLSYRSHAAPFKDSKLFVGFVVESCIPILSEQRILVVLSTDRLSALRLMTPLGRSVKDICAVNSMYHRQTSKSFSKPQAPPDTQFVPSTSVYTEQWQQKPLNHEIRKKAALHVIVLGRAHFLSWYYHVPFGHQIL